MSMSATATTQEPADIESVSPHQVITLLLNGALERIDQAISKIDDGDLEEATVLIQKTMGIVGGLRESLDLEQGGDIANNLDTLYEYILARLEAIGLDDPLITLQEVKALLNEVYGGWKGISAVVSP